MQRAIFAGKCDKSDVVLYLAAVLHTLGKEVAVVDMSEERKYKYHTSSVDFDEIVDEHDGVHVLYETAAVDRAESEGKSFDVILFDIGSEREWDEVREKFPGMDWAFFCTTYRKHNLEINSDLVRHVLPAVKNFATILFHTSSTIGPDFAMENLYKKSGRDPAEGPAYMVYDDESRHRAQIENEHSATIFLRFVPKEMRATLSKMLCDHFGQDPKAVKKAMKKLMRKSRKA